MLNYIWLSLLIIGILVAVGKDWQDLSSNKYHNAEEVTAILDFADSLQTIPQMGSTIPVIINLDSALDTAETQQPIEHRAELLVAGTNNGILTFQPHEFIPSLWKERAKAQNKEQITARVQWHGELRDHFLVRLSFDPVKFVHLNAVTNDGIIRYAKTAVELAIGLIGIMALWLGIMKIAEQAGLVAMLAKFLKPVTTRLFPDVPGDHPAMGAMIMNISANILGLANAATPLGLKAMEELNKLNKKAGTATDAMVTFLVINTSNVQLIPATVIAIRATAGSSNPTDIIGPVIVASAITMVLSLIIVKLMAKLPAYRRQLTVTEEV